MIDGTPEMRNKIILGLALAAAVAMPASALTLTNRDGDAHTVTIATEDATETIVLEADETRTDLCSTACDITLETGVTENFESDASVSINDGELISSE